MIRFWCGLLLAIAALVSAPLAADELRPAVVELTQRSDQTWVLEWKLPVAATQLTSAAPVAQPVIPSNCDFSGGPSQRAVGLALLGHAQLDCTGSLAGQRFGLSELFGRSDAIARMVPLDGAVQSFRLTADAPVAVIQAQPSAWGVFIDYLIIGAEHILLGWDHLLFVIALVLLIRTPWPVVKAATAFTVAHSITLIATTLGYAGLPSQPVETLIALSIVFLAVEVAIVLRDPDRVTLTLRFPWLVAFIFGLLHGFGFAGALADIGLPQGELAAALLAFNLGVELGQLMIVAGLLALLWALTKFAAGAQAPVFRLATYGIGATGSFWLIERVIG